MQLKWAESQCSLHYYGQFRSFQTLKNYQNLCRLIKRSFCVGLTHFQSLTCPFFRLSCVFNCGTCARKSAISNREKNQSNISILQSLVKLKSPWLKNKRKNTQFVGLARSLMLPAKLDLLEGLYPPPGLLWYGKTFLLRKIGYYPRSKKY